MAKISLSDLETLKGLKEARGDFQGQGGPLAGIGSLKPASLKKRNEILDKAIAKFTYVVDNLDQEKASYVKSLFNDQLQLGYETTMSGLKQDAFAKTGFVPIDKETIYSAIVNMDLPKDLKLEMSAIADKKLGAICIAGQLVSRGNPIVIPISAIDDRLLGMEKAKMVVLVRRGNTCKVIMK